LTVCREEVESRKRLSEKNAEDLKHMDKRQRDNQVITVWRNLSIKLCPFS